MNNDIFNKYLFEEALKILENNKDISYARDLSFIFKEFIWDMEELHHQLFIIKAASSTGSRLLREEPYINPLNKILESPLLQRFLQENVLVHEAIFYLKQTFKSFEILKNKLEELEDFFRLIQEPNIKLK